MMSPSFPGFCSSGPCNPDLCLTRMAEERRRDVTLLTPRPHQSLLSLSHSGMDWPWPRNAFWFLVEQCHCRVGGGGRRRPQPSPAREAAVGTGLRERLPQQSLRWRLTRGSALGAWQAVWPSLCLFLCCTWRCKETWEGSGKKVWDRGGNVWVGVQPEVPTPCNPAELGQ